MCVEIRSLLQHSRTKQVTLCIEVVMCVCCGAWPMVQMRQNYTMDLQHQPETVMLTKRKYGFNGFCNCYYTEL